MRLIKLLLKPKAFKTTIKKFHSILSQASWKSSLIQRKPYLCCFLSAKSSLAYTSLCLNFLLTITHDETFGMQKEIFFFFFFSLFTSIISLKSWNNFHSILALASLFFLPIRLSQTMSNLMSDFLFFIYKLSLKMYLCSAKTGTKEIVKIHLVSLKNE